MQNHNQTQKKRPHERKNHYIYLIFDKERKKYYCGKRSTNNIIDKDFYFGSGRIMMRILKKLNKFQKKDRFIKKILHISKSYEENLEQELYWINEIFDAANNPDFYNISDGLNMVTGTKKEHDLIEKVPRKKRFLTQEHRNKISKKNSNEWNPRAKMCIIYNIDGTILFKGIRKMVENYCKEFGICSSSSIKDCLYGNKIFIPKRKRKSYPNAMKYSGIKFDYETT